MIMSKSLIVRVLPFLLSGALLAPLLADDNLKSPSRVQSSTGASANLASTNVFHPLSPGPADGQIAYATALLLQRYHYLRQPLNSTVSSKFLDRYLETLDPQHLHFLQSDLAQFERYRTNLDRLTFPERGAPNTQPAFEIYNRYMLRLEQRVAYADELLNNEKFTFDSDERVTVVRKELPYPKDLVEAKKLWRDRLRYEYLQEKLAKGDPKKKTTRTDRPDDRDSAKVVSPKGAETKPRKTEAEEIVDTLSHRYHRTLRMFIDWDSDDVLQIYLTALAHVYDPHSDYFGHSALESFAIAMNLSLFGIGAELMSEDGYCTINRLLPGGPAIKSKLIKEKDRIVAVAQSNQPPVDVVDMNLNKAVQLIRGPKGTEVKLTIIPAGADERKTISLIRDEIKLEDQEAKAKLIESTNALGASVRIGVIDLPSFYASFDPSNNRAKAEPRSTTADVSLLLKKLKEQNVSGVILDLRRNGGGSLEEAIRLTGLFIKEGPVVQVRDFDGTIQEDDDTDSSVLYDGPLVVLTSRFSASASEIVAGALQDYGRALVVGDSSTHGKGTVQSVQTLKEPLQRLGFSNRNYTNDPGALKLTIKKFYRASGASTQKQGVIPDIVLPSVFSESKEIGESALDNPLEYDTIPKANYEHLNLVTPYVDQLRNLSEKRVATEKEFDYVRQDIDLYKKQLADKTVSLNEKQRLKEKEEADARGKEREKDRKERLSREEALEKVWEISLKQALGPGLPPLMARTNTPTRLAARKGAGLPGVSTNGPIAAARDGVSDPSIEPEEEKPPAADPYLGEARHILVDYLSLLPKGNLVQVDPR
jgi:carboxyl-terminal processing protease